MRDEKYRVFRQVINSFYNKNNEEKLVFNQKISNQNSIDLIPKIIYNSYTKNIKVELSLSNESGDNVKIKSLPEFYDRMLNEEYYKYSSKIEFVHKKEVFNKDSQKLLDFVLKYAEIIKYSNESSRKLWILFN